MNEIYERVEIKVLDELLESNNCQPGKLIDARTTPLAWIMNQMLYDKFHGHGWVLDLLAGSFVKQKENKQCH